MKQIKNILFVLALAVVLFTTACQQPGGNSTGSEFIPDMTHSVAYEANVLTEYSLNTFDESVRTRRELSEPRLPVEGTMPRGFAGAALNGRQFDSPEAAVKFTLESLKKYGMEEFPPNGHVPYYYENSDTGRIQATAELLYNPFPITAKGLERGKELYNIYCGICHGEKADGNGYLVSEDNPNAKYPAQPKNFLLPEYMAASNGRFYHAIMYGINVMGSYADKLSYEERWQVIHYIRSLQAKESKLTYDENKNTFNPEFGVPMADLEDWAIAMNAPKTEEANGEAASDHEATTTEGNHEESEGAEHGHDH
ncbi:MAG: cytochrome c [Bacteroidetes bacterium]|nr:MAG: cytochrome c [Bacteroidota bacterium]